MGVRRGWLVLLALAAAGCGGDRQDANAPSGAFSVDVTAASFPARQAIAEPVRLRLRVVNRGDRAVPNLAVTVATAPGADGAAPVAFGQASGDAAQADGRRPVWIVDAGPASGGSAYGDTWTVGRLAAGQTRTVMWRLTAVRAGSYVVSWRLSPALEGGARLAGSGRVRGRFRVRVGDAPVPARVNADGEVVRRAP